MNHTGSYEAAVESGVKKQAAMKRTKQIMQIRKQVLVETRTSNQFLHTDALPLLQGSYSRAIGGSFEDDYTGEERGLTSQQQLSQQPQVQQQQPARRSYSSSPRMPRKQESYLMAVGEMSPEMEV